MLIRLGRATSRIAPAAAAGASARQRDGPGNRSAAAVPRPNKQKERDRRLDRERDREEVPPAVLPHVAQQIGLLSRPVLPAQHREPLEELRGRVHGRSCELVSGAVETTEVTLRLGSAFERNVGLGDERPDREPVSRPHHEDGRDIRCPSRGQASGRRPHGAPVEKGHGYERGGQEEKRGELREHGDPDGDAQRDAAPDRRRLQPPCGRIEREREAAGGRHVGGGDAGVRQHRR